MANDPKKLIKMYEEYLRENLAHGTKEEIIDQFVSTVLGFMDFNNPEVYNQVVKILLRYELKKGKSGKSEEAQLPQGDEEAELDSNSGEELDFSSMYKPKDFHDLADHINLLSTSHANIIEIEDMLNLASVVKSLRPYMFDNEVPWVGVINDVLCLSWAKSAGEEALVSFVEGIIILEFSHKDEHYELLLDEEDRLEESSLMKLITEAYETVAY